MTTLRMGKILCLAAGTACALLHVASFIRAVPPFLVLVPFFLVCGAILCLRAEIGWWRFLPTLSSMPAGKTAVLGAVLLVYSSFLFFHFYRVSGGATSVGTVDGQYVYLSKNTVIRTISEKEYEAFPMGVDRLWTAWMGTMSILCLSSLINLDRSRRESAS
jgi:hypothetical protein